VEEKTMDYSVQMLARSEHDLMIRSLPTVYDFEDPFPPEPSRWARLSERLHVITAHLHPSSRNQPPVAGETLQVNPQSFAPASER
jgi:hypothetical protein